jgi:hypothetical protein
MTEKTLREADALKSEAEELERRLGCWKPTDPCWDGNAAYWGGRLDSVKVQAEGCWCCRARLASDPEPARALAAPPDKEEGADEPERDDLDDLQLCTCGGTRGDHGGPYGEGACPESSCESFTPTAPAAARAALALPASPPAFAAAAPREKGCGQIGPKGLRCTEHADGEHRSMVLTMVRTDEVRGALADSLPCVSLGRPGTTSREGGRAVSDQTKPTKCPNCGVAWPFFSDVDRDGRFCISCGQYPEPPAPASPPVGEPAPAPRAGNPNIPEKCRGCGASLLLENLYVDDGCPCNTPRGVNLKPQHCDLCRTEDCVKPGHRLQALFGVAPPSPAPAEHGMEALLAAIRADGWAVAVHNDYRLNGEAHTFWGFTKGDRWVKGEGRTDAEALAVVRTLTAAASAATKEG